MFLCIKKKYTLFLAICAFNCILLGKRLAIIMGRNINNFILNKQVAILRKLSKAETCYINNTLNIKKVGLIICQYFRHSNIQTYLVHT